MPKKLFFLFIGLLLMAAFAFGGLYIFKTSKAIGATNNSDLNLPACGNNVCDGIESEASCPSDCEGYCVSPEVKNAIDTIWGNRKQYFINYINTGLSQKNTNILYNIQIYTNNLLGYAYRCKDYKILDDLAEIYLISYNYLEPKDTYVYYYLPGKEYETTLPLEVPAKMWVSQNGIENVLDQSQFLYVVSNAINYFVSLDEKERTQNMNDLIKKFTPVILEDTYDRWIYAQQGLFQVKGWGCAVYDTPNYNHFEFLERKLNKNLNTRKNYSYCNIITDTDMWILAGVIEILSANNKNPQLVPLDVAQKQKFLNYVVLGNRLLQSITTETDLIDFNGNPIKGIGFELGAWADYPDYAYAGYIGTTFPTTEDKKKEENVGWDISHARRWVQVFETLHNNRGLTGQTFPDENIMKKLTNQIIYKVFNGDFQKPLFTNFMDGSNGWYRVGYSGRVGFAYSPYGMSKSFMTSGYTFWSKYNQDMYRVANSMWNMINAIWNNLNQDMVDFARQNYTSDIYSNYTRNTSLTTLREDYEKTNSLNLLMFLPSLSTEFWTPAPICGNGICDSEETPTSCSTDCKPTCASNWQCSSWSTCVSSQQTRTCTDSNSCGTTNKPTEIQSCTTICVPSCTNKQCGDNGCAGTCGTCTGYTACSNGQCETTPTTPPTVSISQMTREQLITEVNRIISLITQLQTQLAQLKGATTVTSQPFTTNLYYGMTNNSEVKRLQQFLINHGYMVKGYDTGNYLLPTVNALKYYQRLKGITPVLGYFGSKTREIVNAEMGVE